VCGRLLTHKPAVPCMAGMCVQDTKVYVQDRLRAEADLVWKLIDEQGAHFYVCGDASSMAGAVRWGKSLALLGWGARSACGRLGAWVQGVAVHGCDTRVRIGSIVEGVGRMLAVPVPLSV